MKLFVRECLESKGNPMPLEYTYEPELTEIAPVQSVGELSFNGKGQLSAGLFRVTGEVEGPVVMECSRCLNPVSVEISGEIEEHFLLDNRVTIDPEVMDDEDFDIHIVEGQVLDLMPFIQEAVLVSLPYAPACADEEGCNQRMNSEGLDWEVVDPENQKEQKIDPRLAKLAQLLEKDEDKK